MLDLTNVEPRKSLELIPSGRYASRIEELELKTSKAGNDYIKAKFVITEGPYKGRVLFSNFNINSPNETARQIALADLKLILESNKKPLKIKDMNHLFNLLLYCTIGIVIKTKKQDDQLDRNEIAAFFVLKKESSQPTSLNSSGARGPFNWAQGNEDTPF